MSVVYFKEITGRDGHKDVDTNKRYRRTWVVRTSNPVDGANIVLAAPGVPAFNDPYQYTDDVTVPSATITDYNAVCVDIRASQDNPDDPQDWRVFAEYVGVEDPLAQPAEVEISPTRYQKALVKDLTKPTPKNVVNSAGDPFESGIVVDRTRFTITISKAVVDFNPRSFAEYQDSVNQETFLAAVHPPGFPAGTCKLTVGAKRMRRAGSKSFYWIRTAVIEVDLEGWKVKVRDAGLNELVYDAGGTTVVNKKRIWVGKPATEATSPQLLNPNGTYVGPLAPGAPVPAPLEFVGYESKSWIPLGLEYSATT